MSAVKELEKFHARIQEQQSEIEKLENERIELQKSIDQRLRAEVTDGVSYSEYEREMEKLRGYDSKLHRAKIGLEALQDKLPAYERKALRERAELVLADVRKQAGECMAALESAEEAIRKAGEERKRLRRIYAEYATSVDNYSALMSSAGEPVGRVKRKDPSPEHPLLDAYRLDIPEECLLSGEKRFFDVADGWGKTNHFLSA